MRSRSRRRRRRKRSCRFRYERKVMMSHPKKGRLCVFFLNQEGEEGERLRHKWQYVNWNRASASPGSHLERRYLRGLSYSLYRLCCLLWDRLLCYPITLHPFYPPTPLKLLILAIPRFYMLFHPLEFLESKPNEFVTEGSSEM